MARVVRVGSRRSLRVPIALGFLFLLSVLIALSAEPGSAARAPSSSELPNAADVAEGLAQVAKEETESPPSPEAISESLAASFADYQEEERQREAELATPEAIAAREASRYTYSDLEPSEAEELLRTLFGDVLASLNGDPARYLSDATLEQPAGEEAATVTSEGETQLLEAGIPVRAENDEGDLSKVDLSLEKTESGYEPVNPLVEVDIGHVAEEGIEVGEEEIGITQVGAEDSPAQSFGDKNIFFGEIEEGSDTDLLVSPTARGVELFDLLRTADSPETLRFAIDLPEGASLRTNEFGGAELIAEDGTTLIQITKPTAWDAQGSLVPVALEVDGSSIVLSIKHREEDLAYPILVDPNLYQDWNGWSSGQNLQGLSAWGWAPEPGTPWWIHHGTTETMWPGVTALFIATEPGNLGANQWGYYYYSAPNSGTYLADAVVNPFNRNNRQCPSPNPYYQPYDFTGMWTGSDWNGGALFNQANSQGWSHLERWGNMLAIGMSTNNGTYIPCWRDLMIGGVSIWLEDLQYPYLDSVGSTPEGWTKKDSALRTFSVSASDAGLGVRTVRMFGVGTQEWLWNRGWCAGTYEQRCPNAESGQITFKTEGFPYEGRYNSEGKERRFSVQVVDPTDKRWALERPLWLDGTPPVISLKGQLAKATEQVGTVELDQAKGNDELSLPTYKLEIEANDGADRSGVKEIKVFLDGKATPEEVNLGSCGTNCPQSLSMNYMLKLQGLSPGTHSLRVVAKDKVDNESDPNRDIKFEYIPATGMKEEYVLQHFPLPDGNDYSGELEYHGPEIAVNVMNGNVVFHQRDYNIETDRGRVELERVYNSQQPTQKDTQWGRGWSIAQAPELEPQAGATPPVKATVTQTGRVTSSVPIPQAQSQTTFSSRLHASITKTAAGYEVEPTGPAEVSKFNNSGRIEEVVLGDNSPVYLDAAEPEAAPTPPTYASTFGSIGTATGQFKHPAGIAVDGIGNLWVVDQDNDRVQKFNSAGQFQSSFGAPGTGDGQFGRPTDIAIDAAGNLWVTDAGNSRVQKFSSAGQFLAKYGSSGTGNGQFNAAESIAIDPKGNIWIGDTYNARLQKFNAAFEFLAKYGSYGSGQGQLIEPTGIDIGPGGNVWVADWGNNRVSVFNETGGFVRQFGSAGAGNGQFQQPDVIEVDAKGNVWVGDQNNGRIQQFNQSGEYVAQFGTKGTGQGQFTFGWPMGLATDSKGNIWVSDTSNNRVQRWTASDSTGSSEAGRPAPYFAAPVIDYEYAEGKLTALEMEDEATQGADPALSMTVSAGLVTAVQSKEGGNTTYEYQSGRLTTVVGPSGQTKYGYDTQGRLTSLTLPNGTIASITYDTTWRATSVKVDPAGPEVAKTTNFSYSAEPRRSIVWGGGNPETFYDIGEDGSIVKWFYAETPPTIVPLSGSLWSKRGEEIENKNHTLFATGSSPHQIASIKVIANGTAVVAEKTCEDPSSPPSHVCDQPAPLEWITHASEHTPGRLDLEVVVTDFFGRQAAERFFVVVPQQPPQGTVTVERPNFKAIKLFREDFGLDRNKSLTEPQMNELILELLYEWETRDPTAMTAVENWGVPMRAPELAEMEWRRQYVNQAAEIIPQWAEEHAASTYGGFYVDEKAGSMIYVGFTENQAAAVEALKQSGLLLNSGQVFPYPTPPQRSVGSLEATQSNISAAIQSNASVRGATVSLSVAAQGNAVTVGATNPSLVDSYLKQQFGSNAAISVVAEEPETLLGYSRYPDSGPVYGGAALWAGSNGCTAGFSGRAPNGNAQGQNQYLYFIMTAGHCWAKGTDVSRQAGRNVFSAGPKIGTVRRDAYKPQGFTDLIDLDAEAILVDKSLATNSVLNGSPMVPETIDGAGRPRIGRTVCWSGPQGGQHCGRVKRKLEKYSIYNGLQWVFLVDGPVAQGDSGGPVWDHETHKAVGLIHSGRGAYWVLPSGAKMFPRGTFTSLLPRPQESQPEGALPALGLDIVK